MNKNIKDLEKIMYLKMEAIVKSWTQEKPLIYDNKVKIIVF